MVVCSVYCMAMNPFRSLLFFFLAIPLLEIYLLIKVGSVFGAFVTVFLVVSTAITGAWLIRLQGLATWQRVQNSLQQGELPAIEMFEALILLVSGALLLTPGFFTDAIGFICLTPIFRRRIALYIVKHSLAQGARTGTNKGSAASSRTIEGEFRRDD